MALAACSNDHAWGTTVGAQAVEVLDALCAKAAECKVSFSNCADGGAADGGADQLCASQCSAVAISSEDDLHQCTGDIRGATCANLYPPVPAGADPVLNFPDSCVGVIKLPK